MKLLFAIQITLSSWAVRRSWVLIKYSGLYANQPLFHIGLAFETTFARHSGDLDGAVMRHKESREHLVKRHLYDTFKCCRNELIELIKRRCQANSLVLVCIPLVR